jgi:hypothetical protein
MRWRDRVSKPERLAYRFGAVGLLCMMVLAMYYRSGYIIVFLYVYFWWTFIAAVGIMHQHLTTRRKRR